MKILQVSAVDFTLKKFLLPLIDASLREGYSVHIACHCGNIGQDLRNKGYRIHHISFARNLNVFSHMLNVFKLVRLLRKEKYDIIHTHTPVASILARLAARIARVPTVIYTAHGFYFHENMSPIIYKVLYTLEKVWGRLFSDYLFFQSKEDYDLALNNHFNRADRLLHIGNGVSAEVFNPELYDREVVRRQLGFSQTDIVFTFVGRMVKEKGVRELVEAFNIIKGRYASVKLMLIGGSVEGDRDSLSIDQLVLNEDIHIMGLRDDIPQLLAASDVFMLPSYREGLPRSIIEAMAMGKPIIATDIRGCREEVIPGYNGFLCQPQNTSDLVEKLLMLLDQPDNITKFGEHSRELFRKNFDENVVIEKQLSVFRKVAKELKPCINTSSE